jgi:oxygen-dependent protoporphyrinogen oxidase
MRGKLALLAGAAIGYVFGTRAGRERYEQIKSKAGDVWKNPRIQDKVSEAEHFVSEKAPNVQAKISDAAKTAADAARSRFGSDAHDGHDVLDSELNEADEFGR